MDDIKRENPFIKSRTNVSEKRGDEGYARWFIWPYSFFNSNMVAEKWIAFRGEYKF